MSEGYLEDKVFCSVTEYNEFGHKVAEFSRQNEDIDHVMDPKLFSSGEFCPKFKVPLSGKTVYISATPDLEIGPQAMTMRVCLAADAAKQNGAKEVVLIAPDLNYSRQDRSPRDDKKLKGQPFSAELQAKFFYSSGIDKILTVHLHSKKIYNIYGNIYGAQEIKAFNQNNDQSKEQIEAKKEDIGTSVVYNLNPNPIFAHYFKFNSSLTKEYGPDYDGKDIVFISPDLGARYHIFDLRRLCFFPESSYCNCKKIRGSANNPDDMTIELDEFSPNFDGLENKIIIIGDDMVDTGGTIKNTCLALMNNENNGYGKPKGIILEFTHPVLAGKSYRLIQQRVGSIRPREIVTTNTHPYIEDRRNPGWKKYSSVLRLAYLISDAIRDCVEPGISPKEFYKYDSVEELMQVENLYDIKRSTLHFLERKK